MILIQRRFRNVIVKDTEICFILENAMGAGGGAVMDWNYKELAATLRAQMASHPPVVVLENETETESIGDP